MLLLSINNIIGEMIMENLEKPNSQPPYSIDETVREFLEPEVLDPEANIVLRITAENDEKPAPTSDTPDFTGKSALERLVFRLANADYRVESIKDYLINAYSTSKRGGKKTTIALKKIARFAAKSSVYGTLGNLSISVQKRIENVFGKYGYDPVKAKPYSSFANLVGYPALGIYILDHIPFCDPPLSAYVIPFFVGLLYWSIEDSGREGKDPCASLPGKLVSLPVEFCFGIYDGLKKRKKDAKAYSAPVSHDLTKGPTGIWG